MWHAVQLLPLVRQGPMSPSTSWDLDIRDQGSKIDHRCRFELPFFGHDVLVTMNERLLVGLTAVFVMQFDAC
jgi:hypothetical protein